MQLHTFDTHARPLPHAAPQVSVPPQPSETVPQFVPVGHAVVAHAQVFVVVLHANPLAHVPHVMLPPQPSG